jgi:hypothetical protein
LEGGGEVGGVGEVAEDKIGRGSRKRRRKVVVVMVD